MMGRSETTYSEIRSWSYPRQGTIRQTVRGSHVDITVRLGLFARRSWSACIVLGGIALMYLVSSAVHAIYSGHAQRLLDLVKGGR